MAGYYTFLMGPQPKGDVVPIEEDKGARAIRQMQEAESGVTPGLATERDKLWDKVINAMEKKASRRIQGRSIREQYARDKEAIRSQMNNPVQFKKLLIDFAKKNRREIDAETQDNLNKLIETNDYLNERRIQKAGGIDPIGQMQDQNIEEQKQRLQGIERKLEEASPKGLIQVTTPEEVRKLNEQKRIYKGILEEKEAESGQRALDIKGLDSKQPTSGAARSEPSISDKLSYYWPDNEFYVLSNERNKRAKQSKLVPGLRLDGTLTFVPDSAVGFMREVNNLPEAVRISITSELASLAEKSKQKKMAEAGGLGVINSDDPAAVNTRRALADEDPLQMVKDVLNRPSMKYQESIWFFVATALATGLEAAAKIWARDTSGSSMVAQFLKNTFEKQRRDQEKELDYKLKAYQLRSMAATRQNKIELQKQNLQFKYIKEANEMREKAREQGDDALKNLADEYSAINTNIIRAERRISDAQDTLRSYEFSPADDPGKVEAMRQLNSAKQYRDDLIRELHEFRRTYLHGTSGQIKEAMKKEAEGK